MSPRSRVMNIYIKVLLDYGDHHWFMHALPPPPTTTPMSYNIIYIQSKSYPKSIHNVKKEILLISHEIMFISVNWHLIAYRNIAMTRHLPHA